MKITQETVVMLVTNVVGMCVMFFGMAQDVADTIQSAVPTIVGGIMSTVSVVTYLINRRKGKETVFNAIVAGNCGLKGEKSAKKTDILAVAKEIGLV